MNYIIDIIIDNLKNTIDSEYTNIKCDVLEDQQYRNYNGVVLSLKNGENINSIFFVDSEKLLDVFVLDSETNIIEHFTTDLDNRFNVEKTLDYLIFKENEDLEINKFQDMG